MLDQMSVTAHETAQDARLSFGMAWNDRKVTPDEAPLMDEVEKALDLLIELLHSLATGDQLIARIKMVGPDAVLNPRTKAIIADFIEERERRRKAQERKDGIVDLAERRAEKNRTTGSSGDAA